MRACDIDMSGEIWLYEPFQHKNRWRGQRRVVPPGPRVQEVVKPFLQRSTAAFLFSPAEAEWERNSKRRAARKSPMTPSHVQRKPKP